MIERFLVEAVYFCYAVIIVALLVGLVSMVFFGAFLVDKYLGRDFAIGLCVFLTTLAAVYVLRDRGY